MRRVIKIGYAPLEQHQCVHLKVRYLQAKHSTPIGVGRISLFFHLTSLALQIAWLPIFICLNQLLLMMVSAFAGHDFVKKAYQEAVKKNTVSTPMVMRC